jgi:hypothetical protein
MQQKFLLAQHDLLETSDPNRVLIDRRQFPFGDLLCVIVAPGQSLPTAGPIYRGVYGLVQGGTGVLDVLYICVKNALNTYEWDIVGGGGGSTYTNATPVPVTIGGIASGTTFVAQTMSQMFDALLYPYQSPAFLTFLMTGVAILEVGDSISGNKTFTWTDSHPTNINPNSIDIDDITNAVNLETGLADTGSVVYNFAAPIQKLTATFNRFRIQATNTNSVLFNKLLDILWEWKVYYGESTTTPLIATDIQGLRVGGLQAGFAGTYVFLAGGYKYLCWPTALGLASSFKDQATGLNVDMQAPYTVNVTNAFSVTTAYYVYRTTYILGGAINIIVA